MRIGHFLAAGLAAAATAWAGAGAQTPDPRIPHADYSNPAVWMCRPDLETNICKANLDATVVPGDGKIFLERYEAAEAPQVDCFFLYPTVSLDPGYQSDFSPDLMEYDDIKLQFARFGSVCRQFAPVYRQTTVTALRSSAGGPQPVGEPLPDGIGRYSDVLDAWRHYITNENDGRGYILVGHSQGSALLARLLAEEIEGAPEHARMISAMILGAPIFVPDGERVGGTFQSTPVCSSANETGCVISYMSFRDRNPVPENTRFGRSRDDLRAVCANPANLAGGKGPLDSYFLTRGFLNTAGGSNQPDWLTPHQDIATKFVKTPGLLSAECVRTGEFDQLVISVNAVPSDPRTDDIAGELVRAAGPDHTWGLHMVDVDIAMGNLINIANQQAISYLAAND